MTSRYERGNVLVDVVTGYVGEVYDPGGFSVSRPLAHHTLDPQSFCVDRLRVAMPAEARIHKRTRAGKVLGCFGPYFLEEFI